MIINLTPHAINVVKQDGSIATFEPSGTVARVSKTMKKIGFLDDFDLVKETIGSVENIPDPEFGVWYIVSAMVFSAVAEDRLDVLAPNTNQAIRDEKGMIIGVPNFITK